MTRRAWSRRAEPEAAAAIISAGVVAAYALLLALRFFRGQWVLDERGHPIVVDFLEVWTAGLSVRNGHPSAPYDWLAHHAAQVFVVGRAFPGFLGWLYPPPALFLAAGLATMPYAIAFIVWVVVTAALYSATIWKITGRPGSALVALAMPAAFGNACVGQNGFFTASLLGLGLLALKTKPRIAGIYIALLAYKPQFGCLFPIALSCGRNWRSLVSAIVVAASLLGLSLAAFGAGPFAGFFHSLPMTAHAILGQGTAGFAKLQSAYGVARWLGAESDSAYFAHGCAALIVATCSIWLWTRDCPFALKASGLAIAAIFITPYVYMYDFPILALPFAFLFQARRFDNLEWGAVIVLNAAMAIYVWRALPIGPLLALLAGALVLRRYLQHKSEVLRSGELGCVVP